MIDRIKNWLFWRMLNLGLLDYLSDETYLKVLYQNRTGKKLNLENPKSYNEKLQWLKLYYRRPEMSMMVDKCEVKDYVSKLIGKDHVIPTIGVWDRFEDIDFNKLPSEFVLKCTHDSGGILICRNKFELDFVKEKNIFDKYLKNNYFFSGREWPYKNVKPRIIAEELMVDESGKELKDYKIFCFDGNPRFIQVDYDRFNGHKRNLYTLDWEYIDAMIEFPTDPLHEIKKPEKLDEMLEFSRVLSKGFPHMRTDFYSINNNIYFGEITFFHGSGCEKFYPESFENKVSEMLKLPEEKIISF